MPRVRAHYHHLQINAVNPHWNVVLRAKRIEYWIAPELFVAIMDDNYGSKLYQWLSDTRLIRGITSPSNGRLCAVLNAFARRRETHARVRGKFGTFSIGNERFSIGKRCRDLPRTVYYTFGTYLATQQLQSVTRSWTSCFTSAPCAFAERYSRKGIETSP